MASKILLLAVALAVVAMVITSTSAAPAEQFNKAGNDDGKDKPQEIIEVMKPEVKCGEPYEPCSDNEDCCSNYCTYGHCK